MPNLLSQPPIIVEVHDGRYDCYGKPTLRSEYLLKVLQDLGGVSDTVADGRYHFNAVMSGTKSIVSLTPIQ